MLDRVRWSQSYESTLSVVRSGKRLAGRVLSACCEACTALIAPGLRMPRQVKQQRTLEPPSLVLGRTQS